MISRTKLERLKDDTLRLEVYNNLIEVIDVGFFNKMNKFHSLENNLSLTDSEHHFSVLLKKIPEEHRDLMKKKVSLYYENAGIANDFLNEKFVIKDVGTYANNSLLFVKENNFTYDEERLNHKYYGEIAKNLSFNLALDVVNSLEDTIDKTVIEMTFNQERTKTIEVDESDFALLSAHFQKQVLEKINSIYKTSGYTVQAYFGDNDIINIQISI